jgi:Flp pilus assembly protein TadD
MKRWIPVLLSLLSAPCAADQWFSAQPIDRQSPDGRWVVHIDLGSSLGDAVGFHGAKKGEFAKATLTGPEGERRTFTLLNPISPVDAVLLDDGTLIAFDNWHNMGHGTVLAGYSAQGTVKWSHPLEALLPAEALERVTMSISSRWWRKDPFEWETQETETGARVGFVTLWNEDKLKINLDTGTVEYVKVQDLGDDPARLLRRGQDLLRREQFSQAAEVLGSQDSRMWLWLELGRTQGDAGRPGDAERVFREFLQIDPTDWLAVEGLARLLLDQSREEETDRLLEQYFEVKSSGLENTREQEMRSAGREIGGFYRAQRLYEKARRYYAHAYPGEHDGLVSRPFAEVLEQCGRYDEALAVLQKSREWMSSVDSFKDDLKEVEVSSKRLQEKQTQEKHKKRS